MTRHVTAHPAVRLCVDCGHPVDPDPALALRDRCWHCDTTGRVRRLIRLLDPPPDRLVDAAERVVWVRDVQAAARAVAERIPPEGDDDG